MESPKHVVIIDYGSGNVRSVFNTFRKLCDSVRISNKSEDIETATHIVLPGVGTFGNAMQKIKGLQLLDLLTENVIIKKKPFLGICVGMQILADTGYEFGVHEGLGWIKGAIKKMDVGELILPHVGWNDIKVTNPCGLLNGLENNLDFYFVHSYHFEAENRENISAEFEYFKTFTAVIKRENIFGVQFHPEKSQKAGQLILENYLKQ